MPTRTRSATATAFVGGAITRYRCAGQGRPVVALCESLPDETFEEISSAARLLTPLPPDERAGGPPVPRDGFSSWLRSFLDVIGVESAALLADERYGAAALGFALLEPTRVDRLAILLEEPYATGEHPIGIADGLTMAGQPLLITSLRPPPGEDRLRQATAELIEFLSG